MDRAHLKTLAHLHEREIIEAYLRSIQVDDDRPPGESLPAQILRKGFEDHAKFVSSVEDLRAEAQKIKTFEGHGYRLGRAGESSEVRDYSRVSVQITFWKDGFQLEGEEEFILHSYRSSRAEELLNSVLQGMTPPIIMELLWEQGRATGPVKLQVVDQSHLPFRNPRRRHQPVVGPYSEWRPPAPPDDEEEKSDEEIPAGVIPSDQDQMAAGFDPYEQTELNDSPSPADCMETIGTD